MSTISTLIQNNVGIPSKSNKTGREIKRLQIGKEVKLSLFVDDMILYIRDFLKIHQKTPRYHKPLQQSSRIQNQSTKSVAFLYTNNEQIERENIAKQFHLEYLQKIKCLGTNFTNLYNVNDFYKKNDRQLRKEIKDYRSWKDLPCSWNQHSKNDYTTKSNLHVQCNSHQNLIATHHRDLKINPKDHLEAQKIMDRQDKVEPKEQCWRYHNT
jgi:hypothetical protein